MSFHIVCDHCGSELAVGLTSPVQPTVVFMREHGHKPKQAPAPKPTRPPRRWWQW